MKEKKVVAIVQARMGSSRLSGKVLKPLGGSTVLESLINRLKNSSTIDQIVIATSIEKRDAKIVELFKDSNIKVFKGRFLDACSKSSRQASDISTIAVSKKTENSIIRQVFADGFKNFGKNFAQELAQKSEDLKDLNIVWHFIGPIQSNKVNLVASSADWVHSIARKKIISKLYWCPA